MPSKESQPNIPPVLEGPHITEKAGRLEALRQYVFRVTPKANKIEIARAVEKVYGVTVTAVRTVRVPGKVRRRGRYSGFRPGYKKAIVTLKSGESIELMPK